MKLYPASASVQLEFDKVRNLLEEQTRTHFGKERAATLRIHTRKQFIDLELRQSYQYLQIMSAGQTFQHDQAFNLSRELKLLSIPGAVLGGDIFKLFRNLAENIKSIEVINNPSSRFDAEGSAGVINIQLKKMASLFLTLKINIK